MPVLGPDTAAIIDELTLSLREAEDGHWLPLADMEAELAAAVAEFGPRQRKTAPAAQE